MTAVAESEVVRTSRPEGGVLAVQMADDTVIRIRPQWPDAFEALVERGDELLSLFHGPSAELAFDRAVDAWRLGWE